VVRKASLNWSKKGDAWFEMIANFYFFGLGICSMNGCNVFYTTSLRWNTQRIHKATQRRKMALMYKLECVLYHSAAAEVTKNTQSNTKEKNVIGGTNTIAFKLAMGWGKNDEVRKKTF